MVERNDEEQYSIDIVAALAERAIKQLWIALIITIVLLVGSNVFWVWRESQFVDETWTYEAITDDGGNAIANGDGEVNYYGEGAGDAHQTNP